MLAIQLHGGYMSWMIRRSVVDINLFRHNPTTTPRAQPIEMWWSWWLRIPKYPSQQQGQEQRQSRQHFVRHIHKMWIVEEHVICCICIHEICAKWTTFHFSSDCVCLQLSLPERGDYTDIRCRAGRTEMRQAAGVSHFLGRHKIRIKRVLCRSLHRTCSFQFATTILLLNLRVWGYKLQRFVIVLCSILCYPLIFVSPSRQTDIRLRDQTNKWETLCTSTIIHTCLRRCFYSPPGS